jgi:hypothetical protein
MAGTAILQLQAISGWIPAQGRDDIELVEAVMLKF